MRSGRLAKAVISAGVIKDSGAFMAPLNRSEICPASGEKTPPSSHSFLSAVATAARGTASTK